jgi:phosphohistidine phosphatase
MTTRRLVLIRHAKAAAGDMDIDRPLSDRGTRDSGAVGRWLVSLGVAPDRVVVSTALRAQQTWEVAGAVAAGTPELVIDDRVYANSVEDLLVVIRATPASVQTLVVVGHNPSMGELAGVLDDGTGDPTAREAIARSYPTGGVCGFDLSTDWQHVDAGDGTVTSFAVPRG